MTTEVTHYGRKRDEVAFAALRAEGVEVCQHPGLTVADDVTSLTAARTREARERAVERYRAAARA